MNGYDKVHTMTSYYDGPRAGVADFNGTPHVYESLFDEEQDSNYSDMFLLMPISESLFRLAMEDWAIWRRWEEAFHAGRIPHETHPALPEDRARHEELISLLGDRLSAKPTASRRAYGDFKRGPASPTLPSATDLFVKWTLAPSEEKEPSQSPDPTRSSRGHRER